MSGREGGREAPSRKGDERHRQRAEKGDRPYTTESNTNGYMFCFVVG